MCAAQAVHMLVEIHHLKTIELVGDLLYQLFLSWLYRFYARSVPLDVRAWRFLVLSTSLDCAAGDLAIVDGLNPMVAYGAGFDLSFAHVHV
jgi:hypothetical protein